MTWNASDPRPQWRGPREPKPEMMIAHTLQRHRTEIMRMPRWEYAVKMRLTERQVQQIELGEKPAPRWYLRQAIVMELAQR